MPELLLSIVGLLGGMVIVLAALYLLHACERGELSLRSISAALIGAGGAVRIGEALSVHRMPEWAIVLLPTGVALWIVYVWREHRRAQRQAHPMRRASDWGELDETQPMERVS
jgi:hypothetical protein